MLNKFHDINYFIKDYRKISTVNINPLNENILNYLTKVNIKNLKLKSDIDKFINKLDEITKNIDDKYNEINMIFSDKKNIKIPNRQFSSKYSTPEKYTFDIIQKKLKLLNSIKDL